MRNVITIGCLLSLLVAGGVIINSYMYGRITKHQIQQLKRGMTQSEVITIVGPPHGKYGGDDMTWYYWEWSALDPLPISFDESGRLE